GHRGQLFELSRVHVWAPGHGEQRRLADDELDVMAGFVEDLLAPDSGSHDSFDPTVGRALGLRYSWQFEHRSCVGGGLDEAWDEPGLIFRDSYRAGLQLS